MGNQKIFRKNDGSKTIIRGGRIVGNLPGDRATQPPDAEDAIIALVSSVNSDEENPQDPDLAILHDLYEAKVSVRTDGDFLAPTAMIPSSLTGSSTDIPKDLDRVASGLLTTFGVADPQQRKRLLTASIHSLGLNRDTRIMDPDEAAMEVSLAMNMQGGGEKGNELLEAIRSREITLTRSEVAILHGLRDELLDDRAESESLAVPFDDEGVWAPPYINRQCTICGKFIGNLGSHSGCDGRKGLYVLFREGGDRSQSVKLPVILDGDNRVAETKVNIPSLAKRHKGLSLEEQQDMYMASAVHARGSRNNSHEIAWASSAIIGQYLKKSPFGKATLPLPKELRDAYLASKVRYPSPRFVAEVIEPPFTTGELEHLVESDDSERFSGARSLLGSPRVASEVIKILENRPSATGSCLAEWGFLPDKTVRNMASSGDSLIRRQAARAKNLPKEEAVVLSTDPDPDVRFEILRRVKDFPETLDNFVNDPDPDLAFRAIKAFPGERNAVVAIGKITSRKRLQAIHDKLETLWDSDTHSPAEATTKTVQDWIRDRLSQ